MVYPNSFEHKTGFHEIRKLLKGWCLSTLGKEKVDEMTFSNDIVVVRERLQQVSEYRQLSAVKDNLPLQHFLDVRPALSRIRMEGTHMEENEVWDLRRSLESISAWTRLFTAKDGDDPAYPALSRLAEGVQSFPAIIRRIDSILDKYGKIKDSASMTLASVRHELSKMEGSISRTLYTILHSAQKDGLIDKDAAPTMRDGRLVIPVAPNMKRRISGIVHDESATGKTVFIEPTEVVEANNRVRQLEAEERREIIRILSVFTAELRPVLPELQQSYLFLADTDLLQAKAEWATQMKAVEPTVTDHPHIDWIQAVHPLLRLSLDKQQKQVVPLDIKLDDTSFSLIISGPNAGGKSVCLKTVGLLQYMLQCGLSLPVGERSTCGIFRDIMIDIGDEQSIDDDLSTYSSHLMNMKQMMRQATKQTLLLIDELGGGTEPTIGGAIAEAVLRQLWKSGAFGVVTTHYQNLKHFADDHDGVVNGAMLYDRHQMKPLFQLAIGQPGSSFAIEIARKTGIPEEVISDATAIVGTELIQSDKYLQDIVRDKRYWEGKRQTIHQQEKRLEVRGEKLEASIEEIERERKAILRRAKEQADELLRETNKKIENAIREIRESQAEKERTRKIREELDTFKAEIDDIDTRANDEAIQRKMQQLQARKERKEKRKKEKESQNFQALHNTQQSHNSPSPQTPKSPQPPAFQKGDTVRIKGLTSVGTIESTDGKMATIVIGGMKTKLRVERLEHAKAEEQAAATKEQERNATIAGAYANISRDTRNVIDNRKLNFRQDLDVRGMRGDEAINAVTYFIDDAILVGMPRVRILHGTGGGILRQLIRQYLSTIPNVKSFRDEHVQFGGTGITVVDID